MFGVEFPHRHNIDGSFDSICPVCFLTVATMQAENDLTAAEQRHKCEMPLVALKKNSPGKEMA